MKYHFAAKIENGKDLPWNQDICVCVCVCAENGVRIGKKFINIKTASGTVLKLRLLGLLTTLHLCILHFLQVCTLRKLSSVHSVSRAIQFSRSFEWHLHTNTAGATKTWLTTLYLTWRQALKSRVANPFLVIYNRIIKVAGTRVIFQFSKVSQKSKQTRQIETVDKASLFSVVEVWNL